VTAQPLDRRRRVGVLLICSMSLFIVGLDISAAWPPDPGPGRP